MSPECLLVEKYESASATVILYMCRCRYCQSCPHQPVMFYTCDRWIPMYLPVSPYSLFSAHPHHLFLSLISFLLCPFGSVGDHTCAWVPHFYSHTELALFALQQRQKKKCNRSTVKLNSELKCCHAQQLGTTWVHEFHIYYDNTERNTIIILVIIIVIIIIRCDSHLLNFSVFFQSHPITLLSVMIPCNRLDARSTQ